jgi:DNA-binding response OmpR family regulator
MLVEDEQDTLLTYKAFLAAEGYNVDAFADSYEAFRHFIKLNAPYYDLVITDIRMPDLNGLQLYQRIKSIDNTVNIMFVSALDSVQELVSIFPDLNLNNIIRKPVTKEEFLNKVKAAIDQTTITT